MPDIFQKDLQNKKKDNKDIFDKWQENNKDILPNIKPTFDVYDINMAGIFNQSIGDKVKMLIDYKVIRKNSDSISLEISNAVNMDMAII